MSVASGGLVSEAEDCREIEAVLTRYAHAVDHDLDLWGEVFTPDALLDYSDAGGFTGNAPEIQAMVREMLANALATQHLVSNFIIAVHGDDARARCSVRSLSVLPGTPEKLAEVTEVAAFYDDQLIRTRDGWRIANRTTTMVWRESRSVEITDDLGIVTGGAGRKPFVDPSRSTG